ncbi:MAG: CpXC domain-containing protein [Anaerolineales bacterium]
MPKIQTSCPNCRQPLVAEIQQVIDVKENPQLKELLLAGGLNVVRCQVCGFQGPLPVPLVYHDREKELLLTFTPPDAGKTMEEKESALAPLLKQVTDSLKPEERKGYLFQPQAMLTMNNLVKNVLNADGITEEMIEAQQEQMRLLDKLFSQEGDVLRQTVRDNEDKFDREFFALFAEIAQRILTTQDEKSLERIRAVQDILIEETKVGKEIREEAEEIRAATKSLEALGKNLTRASLLELVVQAPTIERVKALASLVGQAMDYEFFQMFTDRIEKTDQDKRKELVERRNLLLKISEDIRKQIEERLENATKIINEILDSESVEDELTRNLPYIDQIFVDALARELQEAETKGNEARTEKINQILQILQKLSSPPELETVEKLLEASEDPAKLAKAISEIDVELLPRVIEYLSSIVSNYEEQLASDPAEGKEQLETTLKELKNVFNGVLKKSMEDKFKA